MMKVVCTSVEPCEMCMEGYPTAKETLVVGRAYSVEREVSQGFRHGYILAEMNTPLVVYCSPHFAPIEKADDAFIESITKKEPVHA